MESVEVRQRIAEEHAKMLKVLKMVQAEIYTSLGYLSASFRKNYQAVLDEVNAVIKEAEAKPQ